MLDSNLFISYLRASLSANKHVCNILFPDPITQN